MDEQPVALRLADALDKAPYSSPCTNDAAAELRRLHAVNVQLLDKVLQVIKEMRPAAATIKDKPASWWLDRIEEAVKKLKENT
jgi:hypothetical protein